MFTAYMKYFFRSTREHTIPSIFGTMIEEVDGNLIKMVISRTKAMTVSLTYNQLVKFQIRLIFTIDQFLEYDVTKLLGQWNHSNSGRASIEIKKL